MRKTILLCLLMALVSSVHLFAQDKTVSGKVTSSEDGSALPGVSVSVKGTNKGTTTDANGIYKISVGANATLTLSFIGFETQEIKVGNRTIIDVQMASDAQVLNEVMVVAYGTQEKKTITGSMATVSAEKINRPFASADQALQGAVAGLQSTTTTGQPGANTAIRIRGIGSINAGSDPLYVIDGIPVNSGDFSRLSTSTNALAGLNPADIESVSVLKDAASSSIYGSRAANGVILITTKKGKSGKTKFSVSGENGFNELAIPNLARPLNRQEYLDLQREGLVNAGASETTITNTLNALGANNTNDTDWLDLVTRRGKQQQYDISASGGDNKTTFRVSGGYFRQEATVLASAFDRVSGQANLAHNASEKLSFTLGLNVGVTKQEGPANGGAFANPILAAYFLLPTVNAFNADGTTNKSNTDFPSIYNPVAFAEVQKRNYGNLVSRGNFGLEYRPVKNLTLSSKLGADYNNIEELRYDNPFFGDGRTVNGRAFAYYTRYFNWNWTNLADYRYFLTNDKNVYIDAKVGYEAQKSKTYFLSAQSDGFPPTTDLIYPVVAATPKVASASGSDYSFQSIFSNLAFNYKNRYTVSGSVRRDGSSRFGLNNRFGTFWSVGAAWNIDEEPFFQEVKATVSSLKLRGSYGVNGNGALGNYAWRPTYGYGFNYNQTPGSAPNNVGNIDLTWELNKPLDIGLDFGLFKDRITATIDWYQRVTSDLLLDVPLSRTTGFASLTDNVGAMKNQGWEFAVKALPINKEFSWTIDANIAFNKNTITELTTDNNGKAQDILSGSFIRRVGYDFQTFFAREWAGVDPQTGAPQWYTNKDLGNGEFEKVITNNYNAANRILLGSATPKVFGSVTNALSFKGFTVDAQLYYNFGNYVRDIWARYTLSDGWNPGFNKQKMQLERWQKPGDVTNVPKYIYNNTTNSQEFSSRFLFKGDYLRLRNVTVSYTLPSKLINKAKMDKVSVYARGANLWTKSFDKNLTQDPESGITSEANFNVFMSKTVTFGLNIGF